MNLRQWFGQKSSSLEGNGLSASLEELMSMRRQLGRMRRFSRLPTASCQAGDIKSAFKGRGMELEEIRSYNFGDDIRDIDWRVTARKDTPYTKIYNEEKDREIFAWIDLSASMLFGSKKELKSVTAAKIAALLGWLALENHDRFGCVIFNGQTSWSFRPQNSREHLLAILKKLADVSAQAVATPLYNAESLAKSLKLLEQNAKNKATVFVLSDFHNFDNLSQQELAAIARRNRLYLLDIYDILEANPPQSGEYMAEYAGKRLVFDSSPKAYRQDYAAYFAAQRQRLQDFCRHFGCQLVEFRTDWDIARNLKII